MKVRVAALLHSYTGGAREVEVDGGTVGAVLDNLDRKFPGIKFRIVDEQGQIRPHMNVFVGEEKARELSTPVGTASEIYIVGALSGG